MIQYVPIRFFHIGVFKVHTWGVMFIIAFLISLFLLVREAKKKNIDKRHIYNIALIVLVSGLLGARLFYVFENFSHFMARPLEILAIWQGGLTSYGSLIALFFIFLYTRKKQGFLFFADMFAPYLALSFAIVRIGCFLNWCCYGKASSLPFALSVAGDVARHPTQLYLVAANLIVFALLIFIRNRTERSEVEKSKRGAGPLFFSFLALYSVVRFSIDFLRYYKPEKYFLGLVLSQWICLALLIFSLAMLIFIRKRS